MKHHCLPVLIVLLLALDGCTTASGKRQASQTITRAALVATTQMGGREELHILSAPTPSPWSNVVVSRIPQTGSRSAEFRTPDSLPGKFLVMISNSSFGNTHVNGTGFIGRRPLERGPYEASRGLVECDTSSWQATFQLKGVGNVSTQPISVHYVNQTEGKNVESTVLIDPKTNVVRATPILTLLRKDFADPDSVSAATTIKIEPDYSVPSALVLVASRLDGGWSARGADVRLSRTFQLPAGTREIRVYLLKNYGACDRHSRPQ